MIQVCCQHIVCIMTLLSLHTPRITNSATHVTHSWVKRVTPVTELDTSQKVLLATACHRMQKRYGRQHICT
jgi:hypothetical protein